MREIEIKLKAKNLSKGVSHHWLLFQLHGSVSFSGDQKDIINRLIAQYERLFGRASHEAKK